LDLLSVSWEVRLSSQDLSRLLQPALTLSTNTTIILESFGVEEGEEGALPDLEVQMGVTAAIPL
jgi:hypothetical protein